MILDAAGSGSDTPRPMQAVASALSQHATQRAIVRSPVVGVEVELHWVDAGEGEPLVLLHGGHGGIVHWSANVDDLAADHRVLVPELAGFGASSDPGRALTPAEHADVVAAWLRGLAIDRARLVGFSFGSLVALELALARPDLVEALVLVNPPGVGPRSQDALDLPERLAAVARRDGHRAGIAATLRELMLSRPERITDALIDRVAATATRTRHVTRAVSRAALTLPLLARLAVPARVLIGERDPFHRNDLDGRRAAIDAVLGAGATRLVPEAAHWLQHDRPEAFARELRRFFEQRLVETT